MTTNATTNPNGNTNTRDDRLGMKMDIATGGVK